MNSNAYVSADHILAEVTATCNDKEFRNGLSRGWYISKIQDALQELAFDSFFDRVTVDYNYPTDTNSMDMPTESFNIREIYGWNGSCCQPATSNIIWPKRLYNNKGGDGTGYTARVKRSGEAASNDPYMPNYYNTPDTTNYPDAKYFYNVENHKMMFSPSCSAFAKIRIVFNGIGIRQKGEIPTIPRFFERAINDYVEERYYAVKKGEEPRLYRALWSDAYSKLQAFDGNWNKAIKRVKMMNSSEVEAYKEYLANPMHKG